MARNLGGNCRALVADVAQPNSCHAALAGHGLAVNCAGPFQHFDATLLEACLEAECHYVDIADDRRYVAMVRSFHEPFRKRGLAAVYGCSSLPGISGALALPLRETTMAPIMRVRVSMFIGNKNPKGRAAVCSFLTGLGKPIAAPQGSLLGFRDREVVSLPPPFGRRAVFNFDSPDYDLFPLLLGADSVSVQVGFESRLATYTFALIAKLRLGPWMERMAGVVEMPGRLLSWLGCPGGTVMAELFFRDGSIRRAALTSSREGQRMAAMPCAFVARSLWDGSHTRAGTSTAFEFLGARSLVNKMIESGFGDAAEGVLRLRAENDEHHVTETFRNRGKERRESLPDHC